MSSVKEQQGKERGAKYHLDIEGVLKDWNEGTITTEQIIQLGGWDASQGAILIDEENRETTLQPGQVVQIKHGMGFSKKVRFKRGGGQG